MENWGNVVLIGNWVMEGNVKGKASSVEKGEGVICCIPRRWWAGNVERGFALAEKEALSALEHLRIEIQVHSNSH